MPWIKPLITVSLLLISQLCCWAQYKNINQKQLKKCPVKTINFEQGLMNNETMCVVTDRSGFTWVSTKTGIQRFNGYVLENINPVINHDTVIINYPVIFFRLQNGNIWISYEKGILEYNPNGHIFTKAIQITAGPKGFLPVIPLMETDAGIYCMEVKKGIVKYDKNYRLTQPFAAIATVYVDSILQAGNFISARISASNGRDIFISNSKRILHVNTVTGLLNYVPAIFSLVYGLECNQQQLYVTTEKELTAFDITSNNVNKTIAYRNMFSEPILKSQVYLVNHDQLLISVNRHLYQFDTNCNYQKEFTTLSGDPVVATGYILSIYADQFKRIWLMTNDDLKLVQNAEIPFEHFLYPNAKSNFIKSMYFDEDKKLLLAGCFNAGVQLYDTSGNQLWEKPVFTENSKDIMSIEKLTANDYLIETYFRGWFILNLPSKKIQPFVVPAAIENMLHTNNINWTNNKQRISDSIILIATKNNVYKCNFNNTSLRSATPLLPFLTNTKELYDCFIYTSTGSLWAGTSSGSIYILDKNKQLSHVSIAGNYGARCCVEDAAKHIWMGADKGLYVYTETGKLIKTITRENGLLNDCIYGLIAVDKEAAVFASSNLGISAISLDGKIKNYTKELGLQENEFNNGAALKTAAGKFYFGGVNGISTFYPATLNIVKDTPVINITRLMVNDSVYDFSSNAWQGDSIVLDFNQNHIQLDIAANGLLNTDQYIYSYRLKGLEESWQNTRQPTAIRYTLDPGSYTLEINCSPYLSSSTQFNKTYSIIIHPPWWQRWWFRVLSGLLLIAMIALIVWQYNRRKFLKRIRALHVKHEVQLERERISRDLHDNLGAYVAAIVSNVNRIQGTDETQTAQAITELQSNSQSIVTQLHDTIWALNKEAISLTAISDRFKIFLQKIRPTYPAIDLNVQETIENDVTLSPTQALHLFRIMQEAVNNAVRHSNCKTVTLLIESTLQWKVSIIDDGTGMSEAGKPATGNGLRNMRQRAAEAGWDIQWLSETPNGTRLVIQSLDADD